MTIFKDRKGKLHKKPKDAKISWRISAYTFIALGKEKVLMVMPTWNNQWELPGGGVEIDETINQAIERECYEETGYKVKLISDTPSYIAENNFFLESEKLYIRSIILIYSAKLLNRNRDKTMVNSIEKNEIKKIKWVKMLELNQKSCHHIFWPAISKFLRTKK